MAMNIVNKCYEHLKEAVIGTTYNVPITASNYSIKPCWKAYITACVRS